MPRITVRGWDISFVPPAGFTHGEPLQREYGVAIPFFGQTADGREVTCAVYRMAVREEGKAAGALARIVAGEWTTATDDLPPAEPARLGPFEAVELSYPQDSPQLRVRVGFVPHGPAYGVSIAAGSGPLGPDAVATFEQVCESFLPTD